MKKTITSALAAYRQYRAAKAKSRVYRAVRYALFSIVLAYVLLLCFPQVLFGHQISSGHLTVYAREPLDQNMQTVLERVQLRLAASPINSTDVKPRIFLTNSFGFYSALSLYVGDNSFGKGYGVLPTSNIFINKFDAANDLVLRNTPDHNQRSLSGVIAHEIAHLLVRKRYGYWRNLTMPTWKQKRLRRVRRGRFNARLRNRRPNVEDKSAERHRLSVFQVLHAGEVSAGT